MFKAALFLVSLSILPSAVQAAVNISSAPTNHMSCSAGSCTPTAKNSVLNAGDLAAMLATSDVTLTTGAGAVTIEVTAPFSWASTHVLTLDASLNVSIKAQVVVEARGGLEIIANRSLADGDLRFFPGGKVDFWDTGASYVFNGRSHLLVNDVAAIAAAYASDNNANVALAKDYDAGPDGTYHDAAVTAPMKGNFDGLGHTVSNFSAAGPDRLIGFFSQNLNEFSEIRDLTLSNVHVLGQRDSLVGGLIGAAFSEHIVGVHVSGTVSALNGSSVGGLSGNGGGFLRSDSSADVMCGADCNAGGLVGDSVGAVTLSHASGTVRVGGHSAAGGLVGFLRAAPVVQSYATGDVFSTRPDSKNPLGGLVGHAIQNSQIADSYALGTVHNAGLSALGGFMGAAQANSVKTSYSVGAVTGSAAPRPHYGTGGFVGMVEFIDEGDYGRLYWDIDTSGLTDGCGASHPAGGCHGIKGLSDAELRSALPRGFDPAIWGQAAAINNGYPYLLNNPPD